MVRFPCAVFLLHVMNLCYSNQAAKDFIFKHDSAVLIILFGTLRMRIDYQTYENS
jgi:hypothetical protein